LSAHVPALQTWFEAQVVVQVPQCAGSFPRSTHVPEHAVLPASQTHAPPLQICAAVQAVVQAPQWLTLLFGSVQPPEHSTSGLVQLTEHCPS
jgi:hypothetical protein